MADPKSADEMAGANSRPAKGVSTGTNSRPLNDTIGQAGPGIPDDSSEPVELDPAEAERLARKIRSM